MSVKKWLGAALIFTALTRIAVAQTAKDTAEVAVNGPEGALLLMDGQAIGQLPLPTNLIIPAGPHRFRLELGKQNAESDTLTLPANRQAELNLTLSRRTLIAVLRTTPGMLLILRPNTIPAALREGITAVVGTAAKRDHMILLGSDKQVALLRRQATLLHCIDDGDCHEPLLPDEQVSYVLSLRIEREATGDPASCFLHAALLDSRTRDLSTRADDKCFPCDDATLSTQIGVLTSKMLKETAVRPRGSISVSSSPAGAKVLIEGRWLGMAPFQQEVFAGSRTIEVQHDRYLPHKETVQIEPDQTAKIAALLELSRSFPPPVPPVPPVSRSLRLWRIVSGSVLIGGGILLVGFGASGLVIHERCQDGTADFATCHSYLTSSGGLVGPGTALTVSGTAMLAIPSHARSH